MQNRNKDGKSYAFLLGNASSIQMLKARAQFNGKTHETNEKRMEKRVVHLTPFFIVVSLLKSINRSSLLVESARLVCTHSHACNAMMLLGRLRARALVCLT